MSAREKYHHDTYFLYLKAVADVGKLRMESSYIDREEKREWLRKRGVVKIGKKPIGSQNLSDNLVNTRVKQVVDKIFRYLTRYAENYKRDSAEGKLEGFVDGPQLRISLGNCIHYGPTQIPNPEFPAQKIARRLELIAQLKNLRS